MPPELRESHPDADDRAAATTPQPQTGLRPGVYASLDPETTAALQRDNERMGSALQWAVKLAVAMLFLGPAGWALAHLLMRVRVRGREHLIAAGERGIYAARHFFEWDPFLLWAIALWPVAWSRTQLCSYVMTSPLWKLTALRRVLTWPFGLVAFIPNHEPANGAIRKAASLLTEKRRVFMCICPTGPVGRRKSYAVRYGVGALAVKCPDLPVLPITFLGLQEARLSDILRLRRPALTVVIGPAFRGRDIDAGTVMAREQAVCDRLRAEWDKLEAGGADGV